MGIERLTTSSARVSSICDSGAWLVEVPPSTLKCTAVGPNIRLIHSEVAWLGLNWRETIVRPDALISRFGMVRGGDRMSLACELWLCALPFSLASTVKAPKLSYNMD